ncbi:MAG TPA: outer membrane beta-barrel protein [Telluria sp.]|nr:outer membrane beta-barrel protein [Telluria sp.]
MFKKIALAATLAIAATSSFAQVRPAVYAGVDVGSTKLDGVSDRQSSFGGFVGYQFNQSMAVEAGYRRLADFDDVTINQTHASVIGILPLQSNFNIYARLGYNHLETRTGLLHAGLDGSTSGVLYGVGVGYNFTPNITARLEAQKPTSDRSNVSGTLSLKF